MISKNLRLLFCFLALICTCLNTSSANGNCFIIENPYSGYVLDAQACRVRIQPYDGSYSQLWKLIDAGNCLHYIENCGNRKVLDLQDPHSMVSKVVTRKLKDKESQRWYFEKDHVLHSYDNGAYALSIPDEEFQEGESVATYPRVNTSLLTWLLGSTENQKFILKQKEC